MKDMLKNKEESIAEQNRTKILSAAEKEFALHGLKGARLQEIADRADLPKTNVLYYFKTKEGIYLALLEQILCMWNGDFDHATAKDDPARVLAKYIKDKMEISRTRPDASKIFALEIINGGLNLDEEFKQNHLDWVEGRVKVIQSWVEANKMSVKSPHHLLYTIWGSCQHYADFSAQIEQLTNKPMEQEDFSEATNNLIHIILKGCDLDVPATYL